MPGLSYANGLPTLWYAFVYPAGVYVRVLICLRAVSEAGASFGDRSIPEYLGDRYGSEFLRMGLSLFSLMLLFYLAGQLVAGLVMFERMLGLSSTWALAITASVLLLYVWLGGAHADIPTDGAQGALMLVLAIAVAGLFFQGYGVIGGLDGVLERLHSLDAKNVALLRDDHPLFDSWWDVVAIFLSHVPLGLLPHIGNKLWALRPGASRGVFIALCFAFGMILPSMAFGGLLARAVLGDELLAAGSGNQVIPALFTEVLPVWLAALLGVGILSAVMSTADGLVVSSSQIFANDLYRRSIAPRWHADDAPERIDRRVLAISRWATLLVLLLPTGLAWLLIDVNIALLVWIGIGGMVAALAGPLILGVLWKGVTRQIEHERTSSKAARTHRNPLSSPACGSRRCGGSGCGPEASPGALPDRESDTI